MLVRGDWGLSYGKRGDCCQDPKAALCGAAMEPRALALLARRSPTEQYSSPLEAAGRGSKMSASLKVCLKGTAGPACLSGSLATWKLFYEGHGTAKGLTVENASRPFIVLSSEHLSHCPPIAVSLGCRKDPSVSLLLYGSPIILLAGLHLTRLLCILR